MKTALAVGADSTASVAVAFRAGFRVELLLDEFQLQLLDPKGLPTLLHPFPEVSVVPANHLQPDLVHGPWF